MDERKSIECWLIVDPSDSPYGWMKSVHPSELHEEDHDRKKHERMDKILAQAYFDALVELAEEGNGRALVVLNFLQPEPDVRGYHPPRQSVFDWAYNIHHNTWGDTSFAGTLKARVVVRRINETKS